MEKQKLPFAVHAARLSTVIPVVIIFFNLYSRESSRSWGITESLIISAIGLLLYVVGIILAVIALRGIKTHGPDKIRAMARTGLVLNSLFLALVMLLIPALIKVKNMQTNEITNSQYNAFVDFIQNDITQMVNQETVPVRTFTVEKDGPLAPLMQLLNDGMLIQVTEMQKYDQKVAHINLASYFEPKRLINPEALTKAQKEVLFLQDSYKDFIKTLTEKTNAHYLRIDSLNVPATIKNGFLNGYLEKQKAQQTMMTEMAKIHTDYTQSIHELLSFMEQTYKNCSLEDGYVIFEQDADYEQYSQLFETMASLEEQLLNSASQAIENVYEEIDNL